MFPVIATNASIDILYRFAKGSINASYICQGQPSYGHTIKILQNPVLIDFKILSGIIS